MCETDTHIIDMHEHNICIHTLDGESGLHASMNVVIHMTVEQPSPWVPGNHLHSLESPGEKIKDICTVHKVRLIHTQSTHNTTEGKISTKYIN